ncbi:MAG TPA: DUF1707 domain-containing protein [Pseudonocardiaceae bacterium]|nr:DUF1707 domain-containing protein [Pseudonocardiaceae bacterium]
MTSADAMRASDNDRERVVQALQEQVGEGRITLSEFEQRSTEAYATAKTVGDLRELTRDLPVDPLAPPKPAAGPTDPWQHPYPMPAIPPWAQRTFPANHPYGGQVQYRRVHPVRIAAAAMMTLWLVTAVVGAVFHVFVFPLPLLFIAFILLRNGRRRFR